MPTREQFDKYNDSHAQLVKNGYKICSMCLKNKALKFFYPNKYNRSGYRSRCIECEKLDYKLNATDELKAKKRETSKKHYLKRKSGK